MSTSINNTYGPGLKGKQPLAELQKQLPITKPTFIINSPQLRTQLDQYFHSLQQSSQCDLQSTMCDAIASQQPPIPSTIQDYLSSLRIYTLENPAYVGHYQKYMLIGMNIYELHTISPTNMKDTPHVRNCTFIDDYIESNSTYYLGTPIDLLFHLLPYFISKFHPNEDAEKTVSSPFLDLDDIVAFNNISSYSIPSSGIQFSPSAPSESEPHHSSSSSSSSSSLPSSASQSQSTLCSNHFQHLYSSLFHTSTPEQLEKLYKELSKWCDMSTTHIKSQNCHHFRLNYTKLNTILTHKVAKVCAQITATPSLQSLSIQPNPKLAFSSRHNASHTNFNPLVQLNDTTMNSLALSREHFLQTFHAWDETCTIIFAHALRYLSEYLPLSFFNTFAQQYHDHNGNKFSLDIINSLLNAKLSNAKKKPVQAQTASAMLEIHSDDENDKGNSSSSSKTPQKRKETTTSASTPGSATKKKAPPPPGQQSIFKFIGKK